MKLNDVRPKGGGNSAVVYGDSRFSPVKTQLIVINSGLENEFVPGKELHFHPKSRRNFVWKKNYASAWKNVQRQPPQILRKLLFWGVSIREDVQQYLIVCVY